mmetsp:Transcript_45284/g.98059  ORF Transcript_45284/g.98059 Transcript_45284/m.98059 type:complete len:270 (-) Transcript_45284:82-891(-)
MAAPWRVEFEKDVLGGIENNLLERRGNDGARHVDLARLGRRLAVCRQLARKVVVDELCHRRLGHGAAVVELVAQVVVGLLGVHEEGGGVVGAVDAKPRGNARLGERDPDGDDPALVLVQHSLVRGLEGAGLGEEHQLQLDGVLEHRLGSVGVPCDDAVALETLGASTVGGGGGRGRRSGGRGRGGGDTGQRRDVRGVELWKVLTGLLAVLVEHNGPKGGGGGLCDVGVGGNGELDRTRGTVSAFHGGDVVAVGLGEVSNNELRRRGDKR